MNKTKGQGLKIHRSKQEKEEIILYAKEHGFLKAQEKYWPLYKQTITGWLTKDEKELMFPVKKESKIVESKTPRKKSFRTLDIQEMTREELIRYIELKEAISKYHASLRKKGIK